MRSPSEGHPVDVIVSASRPSVLIGPFDGVHRRSVDVITAALSARPERRPVVALVVDRPGSQRLTSVERRCELLVQHGVDSASAVSLDGTAGLETLRRVLAKARPASAFVDSDVDPDVALLVRNALWCERVRFERTPRPALDTGPASAIRRAVLLGDVGLARRWLGRPHRLAVAMQRANPKEHIARCMDSAAVIPRSGSYLADVRVARRCYRAVLAVAEPGNFVLSFSDSPPRADVGSASIDLLARQ